MALAARVIGAGFSAGQAVGLAGGVNSAVSAAGTSQATATALSASINVVTTAAASSGVLIPAAMIGDSIYIHNAGANAVNIYPPSGQKINQFATNAAVALGINTGMKLTRVSTTLWVAMMSA